MEELRNLTLTAVEGISVGHAQDNEALTGCTVVLCPEGIVCGMEQLGGAPGSRETDLLRPMRLVQEVHAILLCGGSAFGLAAADGVMRYLYERGAGFPTGIVNIPIVPAAVIFDLGVGRSDVFPTAEMGYAACINASSQPVLEGNIGAGIGASVAKLKGMEHAMKAGIGSACLSIGDKLKVAALVVLNALGEVIDPNRGEIIAGVRSDPKNTKPPFQYIRALSLMEEQQSFSFSHTNTIIGVVATNARLTKEEANKVAQMAHNGIAKTIRPAHTMLDGDTIFALAAGKYNTDVNIIGAFAAEAVALSCQRAVMTARSLGGLPGLA